MSRPSAAQISAIAQRVEQASGGLSTRAQRRMEETLSWFEAMSPLPRAEVGLLVQAGIRGLADWLRVPEAVEITGDVFAIAPLEMARVVTLEQTIELVRIAVEVTEDAVEEFATPTTLAWTREAVLRYSREIAFAAAVVYARAAEQRGRWMPVRLEALVVDAIVRGDVSDSLLSRASALGWSDPEKVIVIAGRAPDGDAERLLAHTRRLGLDAGAEILTGVQTARLLVVAGVNGRTSKVTKALLPAFADGPIVVGPEVGGLFDAATSVQDVFAGLRAVIARPDSPRPVAADDLLPERALAGDARAGRALIATVFAPLAVEPVLLATADAFIDGGGAIEATARTLFVHANTIRYRIRRIGEVCGFDLSVSRDRYVVQVALALGRMDAEQSLL